MLKQIADLVTAEGFEITWIDSVVITERPKLAGISSR